MKRVFIEMEKLKNLKSGLGQVNLHLGNELVKQNTGFELLFYLPADKKGIFGHQKYIETSVFHKFISPVPKGTHVWHGTHQQTRYLPADKSVRKILTVHDLNFLYKYQGRKRERAKYRLQTLVDKMDVIVAISQFTSGELQNNIILRGKIPKVIYNGNTLIPFADAARPHWLSEAPYLFTVGVLSERKNFKALVGMMSKIPDLNLVIAGNDRGSYADQIRTEIKLLNLDKRIFLPGEIDDREKFWLYANCTGFVLPSLAEGFGLPVIEAMCLGKPVFISNKASLPEIGGNLAFYFQNFDAEEMAKTIEKGLDIMHSDNSYSEKLKAYADKFSWKNSAREYLKCYSEV